MGADVACVTANAATPYPRFSSVAEALARSKPNYVLVANQTARHAQTLRELSLAGFRGRTLVEKPVFAALGDAPAPQDLAVFVAYNLRFHPLVQQLHQRLAALPIYSASFYAGQYLPQWRPDTNYRSSYSARKDQGGGVLRDLSHEIDLALWLCGRARRVTAIGGHFSDLDMDSDDVFSILSINDRCPAISISVNYLDRMPRRLITVNAQDLTASLDLIAGTLTINGETTVREVERDATYHAQLHAFLGNDASALCTFEEGCEVLRFVEAAESASMNQCWTRP